MRLDTMTFKRRSADRYKKFTVTVDAVQNTLYTCLMNEMQGEILEFVKIYQEAPNDNASFACFMGLNFSATEPGAVILPHAGGFVFRQAHYYTTAGAAFVTYYDDPIEQDCKGVTIKQRTDSKKDLWFWLLQQGATTKSYRIEFFCKK